ncbi:hypothetical protein DPEC_G00027180 [Dallia pectoralis]|uniref:Uncharacterized protein n=1 Tax=Dallia pectoralis TaxID=75939 RepID=A0ACC2HHP8_DALPE|nr:hypothetical protein DPEC_G00027180 [Dallia pectoralis]
MESMERTCKHNGTVTPTGGCRSQEPTEQRWVVIKVHRLFNPPLGLHQITCLRSRLPVPSVSPSPLSTCVLVFLFQVFHHLLLLCLSVCLHHHLRYSSPVFN